MISKSAGLTLVGMAFAALLAALEASAQSNPRSGLLALADLDGAHMMVVDACTRAAPESVDGLKSAFESWRAQQHDAQLKLQAEALAFLATRNDARTAPVSPETVLKMFQEQGLEQLRRSLQSRSPEDLRTFCMTGYAQSLATPDLDFAAMLQSARRR